MGKNHALVVHASVSSDEMDTWSTGGRVSECCSNPIAGFQTTIQHWQLRDLVHCPERENELYFTNKHQTLKCTPDEKVIQDVLKVKMFG